ncbi:restriction endonuclease [Novosphingobium subterraneum]|uniref:restriction endonuclease n=1 Tax=Novosphingobium subterraneum TaxID=48936 RepID=UPI003D00FCD0
MPSYNHTHGFVFLAGYEQVPDEVVDAVFKHSGKIFAFFQSRPDLLACPYELVTERRVVVTLDREAFEEEEFEVDWNPLTGETELTPVVKDPRHYEREFTEWTEFVRGNVHENEVWRFLEGLGLDIFRTVAIEASPLWKNVSFPEVADPQMAAEAYATIDLLMYLFHVMNTSYTLLPRLRAAYYSNVVEDATGQKNTLAAEEAIDRIIEKHIGRSQNWIVIHTPHVIRFIDYQKHLDNSAPLRDGMAFEQECLVSLRQAGFTVMRTKRTGDFGADLVAERDEIKFAIQCKDTGKPAGVKAVQEAAAARRHYVADYAVVCSRSGFTPAAVELAASNDVTLATFRELVRRLSQI